MSINDEILAAVNNCLYDYGCVYPKIANFLHFTNNFAARQVAADERQLEFLSDDN